MLNRRGFLASAAALAAQRAKWNVLFIAADDLNNDLGCYGHPLVKSPNLDRLASRGVIFDNAYCQYPLCQPSRTSLLSGRRPETTRVWTLQTPTRRHLGDAVFLPEYFKNHGYHTVHAGKIYHTGDHAEDARSWDVEYRDFGKNPSPDGMLANVEAKGVKNHSFRWGIEDIPDEETPDGMMARKAVQHIEQSVKKRQPFFVATGFRRPHSPYIAPKKYFDLYPLDRIPLPATPLSHHAKLVPASVAYAPPDAPLPDRTVREYRAAYYASTSFMDAQVGVLLNSLDRLDLWKNTAVLFFGDHGYHLGDHGGLWHKLSLFEQSARAPLIVYAPGQQGNGKRSRRLVEFVDFYQTLAELAGLPEPQGCEGLSFAPLLADPSRPWKQGAFTMLARDAGYGSGAPKQVVYLGKSVRTERFRYTEWDQRRRGVELYDHLNDPGELNNLAAESAHDALAKELHRLLEQGWKSALPEKN
jgi:uncharacterized sulfatase